MCSLQFIPKKGFLVTFDVLKFLHASVDLALTLKADKLRIDNTDEIGPIYQKRSIHS